MPAISATSPSEFQFRIGEQESIRAQKLELLRTTAVDLVLAIYTDELARDALGTALTAGAGITITPDDGANIITIASTITQYTTEMAQDAIGAMVDSSLVYVDATPLLTRAALTGDATAAQGSNALTLATVNSNTGTYGGAATSAQISVNGKGLITGVSAVTITPAWASITSTPTTLAGYSITGSKTNFNTACTDGDFVFTDMLGTGVTAALAINVGSAGAFVTFNGALGTPSSGTLTNCTGLPISGLTASTVTAIGVGTVELGHASDTTLARSGAGDVTIEGNTIYRVGGTDVSVADGGTGRSTSTTAYGLIAAGTTATGAHQTLPAGATTDCLVGGGASALPVWTTATGTGAPVRASAPTIDAPAFTGGARISGSKWFRIESTGSGGSPTGTTGPGGNLFTASSVFYFEGYDYTAVAKIPIMLSGSEVRINSATTASAANVYQASDGSALLRSTSSREYKTGIEPIEPEYAQAILGLEPVFYRSKAPADNPEWGWWGLIAEDVAAVDPRLVHWGYRPEDYDRRFRHEVRLRKNAKLRPDGVQYERLSVLLLSLVQEQQRINATFEARLAALEAR